jgi:hypothetical protein
MSADRLEAAEECDVCSERLNVDFTCPNVGDPTHDRLEDELWDERVGPDAMTDREAELVAWWRDSSSPIDSAIVFRCTEPECDCRIELPF